MRIEKFDVKEHPSLHDNYNSSAMMESFASSLPSWQIFNCADAALVNGCLFVDLWSMLQNEYVYKILALIGYLYPALSRQWKKNQVSEIESGDANPKFAMNALG